MPKKKKVQNGKIIGLGTYPVHIVILFASTSSLGNNLRGSKSAIFGSKSPSSRILLNFKSSWIILKFDCS